MGICSGVEAKGDSAAPRHAAPGGVGGFNQAEEFMGSEPWLRGSSVLSSPRYCRYAGLLEDFITSAGFQISLSNSEQVHFKAPFHLPEVVPLCFALSMSFPFTPNTPASSCAALLSWHF